LKSTGWNDFTNEVLQLGEAAQQPAMTRPKKCDEAEDVGCVVPGALGKPEPQSISHRKVQTDSRQTSRQKQRKENPEENTEHLDLLQLE
jgi:hypothetical protein